MRPAFDRAEARDLANFGLGKLHNKKLATMKFDEDADEFYYVPTKKVRDYYDKTLEYLWNRLTEK